MQAGFDNPTAVIVSLVLAFVSLAIWIAVFGEQRTQRAQALHPECEYLGAARDLSGVAFYDCAGKIILERLK